MPVLDKKQNSLRIEDPLLTEKHRVEERANKEKNRAFSSSNTFL